jgi:RHS repeat-associated protein
LAEYEDGNLEASYTYGLDLIEQERDGNESYYSVDGLVSTRGLTDENGEVTDTYIYDAYGNVVGSAGTTENDYRFAGEQWDGTLGQYYLRQRYYDPQSGRFTRRDTYEGRHQEPITLHKYLYANSNPVSFVDPTGLYAGTLQGQNVGLLIFSILAALSWITVNYIEKAEERICRYAIDEDHIFFPDTRFGGVTGFHSTYRADMSAEETEHYEWVGKEPEWDAEYEPFYATWKIPNTNLQKESSFFPIGMDDYMVLDLIGKAYVQDGCKQNGPWSGFVKNPQTGETISIQGTVLNHLIQTAYPVVARLGR